MGVKCARESCAYEKNPDRKNNGGRYCCRSCKKNHGFHGTSCSKTPVFYKAKHEIYGFLENTLIKSFSGLNYKYDSNKINFENKEDLFSGLKALCESDDEKVRSGTCILNAGDVLENTNSMIKLCINNVPSIVLRKMILKDKCAYFFVLTNLCKDMPTSYGRKLDIGISEI